MSEMPAPIPRMAVATHAELVAALERATDVGALKELSDRAAAVHDLVRRMQMAVDEQNRLAEFRLRVGQKLGRMLMEQVHRGGCGSKSREGTSKKRGGSSAPIPEGISKMQALRYRQLASVSEAAVVAYLAAARRTGRPISVAGLLRCANHCSAAVDRDDPRSARLIEIVTAVRRVTEVQMTVGLPQRVRVILPEASHLDADSRAPLQGNVLVLAEADPAECLARVAESRAVREGVVVAPAQPSASWFCELGRHDWTTCFVPGPAARIVAYAGERRHAFFLVFRGMGTVVRTVRG